MGCLYQTLAQDGIWVCRTTDKQDGRQNGRRLSVCTCGQSNLVIYHPISSKFHTFLYMNFFYQTLARVGI